MDIEKIKQKTLNKLIDQYEKSKTFTGDNQVNQTFSKSIGELFPQYQDDAEYELFCDVNEAMKNLEMLKLVTLKKKRGNVLDKVYLNTEKLPESYKYLERQPKKELNESITELFDKYSGTPLLDHYFEVQRINIENNRRIDFYDGSQQEYEDLLYLCREVLLNEEELFIRDFSMRCFGDSKKVESLLNKAQALLYQYGEDFSVKESVFEECGIVRTPTYVYMKGKAKIFIGNQSLDLSQIKGDIALSTASIKEITDISISASRIVTIENLTSFHDIDAKDMFVIYLGGFHNRTKCEFLKFIFLKNPDKKYLHFGDIDAGGFYIFDHLKRKTGIPFDTFYMDIPVLEGHKEMWKALSENDKRRLKSLLGKKKLEMIKSDSDEMCINTIEYMLKHNCKLEQEAVMISS